MESIIFILILLLALGILLLLAAALCDFYVYIVRKIEKRRLIKEQMELQELFLSTYQEMLREAWNAEAEQNRWYK